MDRKEKETIKKRHREGLHKVSNGKLLCDRAMVFMCCLWLLLLRILIFSLCSSMISPCFLFSIARACRMAVTVTSTVFTLLLLFAGLSHDATLVRSFVGDDDAWTLTTPLWYFEDRAVFHSFHERYPGKDRLDNPTDKDAAASVSIACLIRWSCQQSLQEHWYKH